ncbi:hypothetical protein CRENBAI_010380 [Crenichthys baileyi]|uniref:Uncharacterized protein n=1 Tax=Crenichthys baileyi TaxID=28760 RepID=A0AAV9S813_9TELE
MKDYGIFPAFQPYHTEKLVAYIRSIEAAAAPNPKRHRVRPRAQSPPNPATLLSPATQANAGTLSPWQPQACTNPQHKTTLHQAGETPPPKGTQHTEQAQVHHGTQNLEGTRQGGHITMPTRAQHSPCDSRPQPQELQATRQETTTLGRGLSTHTNNTTPWGGSPPAGP